MGTLYNRYTRDAHHEGDPSGNGAFLQGHVDRASSQRTHKFRQHVTLLGRVAAREQRTILPHYIYIHDVRMLIQSNGLVYMVPCTYVGLLGKG